MENNLKAGLRKITLEDLGCTEDEWSNFLIDCHNLMNGKIPDNMPKSIYESITAHGIVQSETPPPPVTIKLTFDNWPGSEI